MTLNIVELNDSLKNVRRARSSAHQSTPAGTPPLGASCGCNNRLGLSPAAGEASSERRQPRSRHNASFAALGR